MLKLMRPMERKEEPPVASDFDKGANHRPDPFLTFRIGCGGLFPAPLPFSLYPQSSRKPLNPNTSLIRGAFSLYPTAAFGEFRTKLKAEGWYDREPFEEARLLILVLGMFIWSVTRADPSRARHMILKPVATK